MRKIGLISRDASLKKELSGLLPSGYKFAAVDEEDGGLVFFDIDSMRPGRMKELGDKHLVIAFTRQKKTEAVMEATTFGAYEIVIRPVKKEALRGLLEEVEGLWR